MIHLRLQEFKNNDKFGGINIVLFGDIMQLPPVKGHWCFVQPAWFAAEINLWHAFSFCELTINMRQRNDTEFVDLLNNLRVSELTTGQVELLCQRRRVALDEEFKDGVVIRIFPTVKQVDEYNDNMTAMNSKQNRIYTIRSIDESREIATYGKKPPDNVVPKDVNNCGGLLSEVKLAAESRVMLRRNISVSDGLVNGAMGRCRLKDSDGCVAIPPVVATFQGTKGYGDIERRMLSIILCWAVTVHKLQGTTLDKAVIDLGKKVFAKGQAYVALSRVKTLEGIALSDLEPNKLLHKPHDERALAEMQRLRALNQETDKSKAHSS
ncbi:ATP-dependent DNA helicase PIF1-like [Uloborus diversus]|uniref:ATP-dependent DNA helicase PIF1-like n=1 Tax=Uloborus diversus TaxID=327109 RepID=UPI00240A7040|nr:ATP-dependent DNA helicase PIF1-like [Uloborus diversus]